MRQEIRIAGYGGQGIIMAGVILGEAAAREGKYSVQTQSYGPESRGGAARAEVVISGSVIDYPKVISPDILVILSQPGFDKYIHDIKKDTQIVVDADLVKADDVDAVGVPFLKTSENLGRKIVANVVMLGYITSKFELVSADTLEKTLVDRIPKGSEELNLKAFREGWKMGANP